MLLIVSALAATTALSSTAAVGEPDSLEEVVAVPVGLPDDAADDLEDGFVATLADPDHWAGGWYDTSRGQVVLAVVEEAPESVRLLAAETAGPRGRVVTAGRSAAELMGTVDRMGGDEALRESGLRGVSVDWPANGVTVGLTKLDEASLATWQRIDPRVSGVEGLSELHDMDGPERWRDRWPYWGGSGYSNEGDLDETRARCSTAFAMRRPDNSKHFMVTAGHCTSTHPAMGGIVGASTLDSAQTAWTNDIGTSAGYVNSLCVTTGSSCTRGERMYGDISVLRVAGNAARLYYGYRTGNSVTVSSTQTGLPAVGDSMCVSGAATGTTCGYVVSDNYSSIWVGSGEDSFRRSPVVRTGKLGGCASFGDSGAAVYKTTSAGARASGVLSGGRSEFGECAMHYTSIAYAQELFAAEVVLP